MLTELLTLVTLGLPASTQILYQFIGKVNGEIVFMYEVAEFFTPEEGTEGYTQSNTDLYATEFPTISSTATDNSTTTTTGNTTTTTGNATTTTTPTTTGNSSVTTITSTSTGVNTTVTTTSTSTSPDPAQTSDTVPVTFSQNVETIPGGSFTLPALMI